MQLGANDLSRSQLQVLFLLIMQVLYLQLQKNVISLISVLTIWWCPCVKSSLVLFKRVFAMTTAFSCQNSVSLCPASFCIPKPTWLLLQVSLDFLLFHSNTLWWIGCVFFLFVCLFLVLVLRGLLGLHRTNQLWVPLHWWLGHRLELLWCWMICLGNEPSSFCHFWGCTQVLHFRLFCWLEGLFHFF